MRYFRACFAHLSGIERKRIPPTPADDLRLHRLEHVEPWPADLLLAIRAAAQPINLYPDYAPFYERLSEFFDVPHSRIVVGAGIESLIRDLVMLCCDPGDRVAYTWPTCAMFDIYARAFGAVANQITVDPDHLPTADDIVARLPKKLKLLILANPGQPVETCFDPDGIARIAEACRSRGAILAIDEAYYGFGAPTALPLIDAFDNLVVLRTFSKAFGAAALRVGFAIGQRSVIAPLDAVRQSGEISGPSLTAATILMDHWRSHVLPAAQATVSGREWLRWRLYEDHIVAHGSVANHLLIDLGDHDRMVAIGRRLWQSGTRVKFDFPAPVDRHLLVTCGSLPLMKRFHREFRLAL